MMQERTFHSRLECHYVLQVPESLPEKPLVVVALHGYGQNASTMLRLCSLLFDKRTIIASLQAPNQQYLPATEPHSAIGYNWGTRDHWDASIKLHHQMILQVLHELQDQLGSTPERTLLAGFSQPVGLNYRFAATHLNRVGGVLGICGGVPKDWEDPKHKAFSTPILHIARDQDEFFPAATAHGFPTRLRHHASDVEFHMLPGGHRFPSKGSAVVTPWLQRVFGVL